MGTSKFFAFFLTFAILEIGSTNTVTSPKNIAKVQGANAILPCKSLRISANEWYRDGIAVMQISSLKSRVEISDEASLTIRSLEINDSGPYECRVTNGNGEIQTAVTYLNVEYPNPAEVTYSPTLQYLPGGRSGVVRCYISSNPPINFVMWVKDNQILQTGVGGFELMENGSLLIENVKQTDQGIYICMPYNIHGTKGPSLPMKVVVKEPPKFEAIPEPMYKRKLGSSLTIPCTAAINGSSYTTSIRWQKKDGQPFPRARYHILNGSLVLENLQKTDYGEYECVASDEFTTVSTSTKIVVEGTRPHPPKNITTYNSFFDVTLYWIPGYPGGSDVVQNFVVWYRILGESKWETIPVTPRGRTKLTVGNLSPGITYEFQVAGINDLGEGDPSEIIVATTKDLKPGEPYNITVTESSDTVIISWHPPMNTCIPVSYYTIEYRMDNLKEWKIMNEEKVVPPATSYRGNRRLRELEHYVFRISAFTTSPFEVYTSEEIHHQAQLRDTYTKQGIIGDIVEGILFFAGAIILAICAVKICNRMKRRK